MAAETRRVTICFDPKLHREAHAPSYVISARLTPEDVERLVAPHSFLSRGIIEVGPYNYLMIFKRSRPGAKKPSFHRYISSSES